MGALKRATRGALVVGALLLAGTILYFVASETYLYMTRSEPRAQAAAQQLFMRICSRQGVDPSSFRGPDRPSVQSDERLNSYTFVWTRNPQENITISVTYLPYDLPYSISEGITERKGAMVPGS